MHNLQTGYIACCKLPTIGIPLSTLIPSQMQKQTFTLTTAYSFALKYFFLLMIFLAANRNTYAQCPPNIDFEQGDFTGWYCWKGDVAVSTGKNLITWTPNFPLPPDPLRHIMLSSFPGDGNDFYGGFPKNCPNGSGHSIQLGNEGSGSQAEGVSYRFTIPAGANEYSLIYHYAIVIQDPAHGIEEQPRMIITVRNISDGVELPCPLAPFVPSGGLPGFDTSKNSPASGIVLFKKWAAASIKLDNLAGKTIELFFKTADCTRGGHFGYAYIDVNSECSSLFTGAVFCPDDAFINVTAPYGYQGYKWWDATDPTTIIGITQTINFTPPPTPGTVLKVEVIPYSGYGCVDTLTAVLIDTLTIQAQAGPDKLSCNNTPVQIGANPKPGYVYSWTPAAGLSDPNIANPIATPAVTTDYIVTVKNAGGGCASVDTVTVTASVLDNSILLIGPASFCNDGSKTAMLEVQPADSIQWYMNNVAIPGANQTQYNVLQTGTYHATVFSFVGCSNTTADVVINIFPMPVVGFTINTNDQCLNGNQYVFTNTSTLSAGTMLYDWDFGDGVTATTRNANHSYLLPGAFVVRLIVTTDNGCKDSSFFTVNVYDSPVAGFTTNTTNQCFNNHQFVFTNTSTINIGTMQYAWDFGDGTTAGTRDASHSYAMPGTYTVRMIVTSDRSCPDEVSSIVTVYPNPVVGFTANTPDQCLNGNQFVFTNTSTVTAGTMLYNWDFGDGTTGTTRDITHSYLLPGTYSVRLIVTTNNSCTDSSFFTVNVYESPLAGFTVNTTNQCFNNNQFVFTNTSTINVGTMQYSWDFGDGTTAGTRDANHSYTIPGTYTVKMIVTSDRNCPDEKSFVVTVYPSPVVSFATNAASQCFKDNRFVFTNTSTITAGNMQYVWDMGNGVMLNTKDVTYSYTVPGNYTVKLLATSGDNCKDSSSFNITVNPTPVAGFTVNNAAQCLNNNQFVFTNTSTVYSGNLQYQWNFGDGASAAVANVNHSYAQPGTYIVKMLVTADGGCVDSSSFTVVVFQYPVANFSLQPTCINLPVQLVDRTVNTTTTTLDYLWDFGNGDISNVRNPVYSYPAPGNYTVKLTVNITNCPTPVTTREIPIVIDAPVPAISYHELDARFNFPEQLNARQIGTSVLWTPATSLNNPNIYSPIFKGVKNQTYLIQLKTDVGCITVDTQVVKTLKKIKIYVPAAFTPDNNGTNDRLRPLLFGFTKVNYFRVYNRWGKLLFQMQSDYPGWDGRLNGVIQDTQAFVWMIEAVDVDGVVHRQKGTTVLLR